MEHEASLQCSQELPNGPYTEPDESSSSMKALANIHHCFVCKIYIFNSFNIYQVLQMGI
jgi:hypothetical protein